MKICFQLGNDVDMKDETAIKEGRLNTKDCLHSLALLRRAKWFQARANSLQNCVLVIRIMRDFCLRTPVWSNLDLWVRSLHLDDDDDRLCNIDRL